MIDWSGSPDSGTTDVGRSPTIGAVLYNSTGSFSFVAGCVDSIDAAQGAAGTAYMVGSRGNELGRYFKGALAELLVYPTALSDAERGAAEAYLAAKWSIPVRTNCSVLPPINCSAAIGQVTTDLVANLTAFVGRMRGAGYPDARYESAHVLLFQETVSVWYERCSMLNDGSLAPLQPLGSQTAADELFTQNAADLGNGLVTVLESYATSSDPDQQRIYALFRGAYN
jgi:hypothetical protein